MSKQAQQTNLYAIAQQETDAKADAALLNNGVLPETSLQEYNQKTTNEIYLSTIAKGNTNFSAAQQADLYTIAHQCLYQGGRAVYEARAMYALYSDELYDDIALCSNVGIAARTIKPRDKVEGITERMIKVYPNPTSDFFTLSLSKTQETTTTIELIDVLGRVVQQSQLAIGSTKLIIPIVSLTSGVYHCKVSNENGVLHTSKLVITK